MAYDKYTWQTGEVITQEKLNHMEDGIEDAYELPAVTETDNGKVLGVEDGAWSVVNGGSDVGYECTETSEELFSETVTTVAQGGSNLATLAYSTQITADTLELTFDGVKHVYEKQVTSNGNLYGTPGTDPVALMSSATQNMIVTQNAGQHTLKAEVSAESVNITECFEKAVKKTGAANIVTIRRTGVDGNDNPTINIPYADFEQLLKDSKNGKTIIKLDLDINAGVSFQDTSMYVTYFFKLLSTGGSATYRLSAIGTISLPSSDAIEIRYIDLYVSTDSCSIDIRTKTI